MRHDETVKIHISLSIAVVLAIDWILAQHLQWDILKSIVFATTKAISLAIRVSSKRDGHINRLYKYHSAVKIEK